jgi:hypothetical protein
MHVFLFYMEAHYICVYLDVVAVEVCYLETYSMVN